MREEGQARERGRERAREDKTKRMREGGQEIEDERGRTRRGRERWTECEKGEGESVEKGG